MSTRTSNLGLFKYDVNTDASEPFSITQALNENWDIIDESLNDLNGIMPNYASGAITFTSPYTTPSNGYVYIQSNTSNSNVTLKIDNQLVYYAHSEYNQRFTDSGIFPVGKNSVITTSGGSVEALKFYPMKGAN